MQFHPAQERFVADRSRYTLAVAGHQGGKTLAAAKAFGERLRELYNERVRAGRRGLIVNAWVVTPTYELATMPQRYLRGVFGPQCRWRGRMRGIFLECEPWPGCIVKFRSAEHPEKLVSEPVDAMWANETARIKADAWRGNMRMRLTATNGWLLADTTPLGQNWVYQDLYLPSLPPGHPQHDPERYDPSFSSHLWHTADNPAVSTERVEEARRTLPAAYFAREFLADFSAFHGQIYPHFTDACVKHSDADAWPELAVGIDWGYAPGHLGVFLVMGLDRAKRTAAVLAEVTAEGKTDEWWATELLRLCERYPRIRQAVYDPSAPDKAAYFRQRFDRERKAGGIRGLGFLEADNAVRDGIMCVADLLGSGLTIDPSCKVTIRQMRNYHWLDGTERSGGEWQEKPAKVDDDCCDALRYVAFTLLRRARARVF